MDITPYTELRIAPKGVFDNLAERRERPRFMLPVADGWRAVTWGEFAEQIRRVALYLAGEGLRPGDRACVFAPNRVEWISAALGIQAAGGVMVPVYPSSTAEQAAYVVEHSDARFLFVDTPALLARIYEAWGATDAVCRIVLFDDAIDPLRVLEGVRAAGKPSVAAVEAKVRTWTQATTRGAALDREDPGAFERTMDAVSLDQPGVMLYTSGTSGNPKGVPLTHRNVGKNGLDWLVCNAPLIEEGATDLLWLPMSHIFGFGEACLGNTLGFTSYLVEPLHVLAKLPVVRPNVFMSVPSVFEKLATLAMAEPTAQGRREKLSEVTGGRLQFCLSGGAGLKREVKELFHESGLLIIEGYGLTEASPTLTLNRPDAFRFDTVGKPLPSVQLRLADDGEILAKGDNVFAGYHKDPEATAQAFTEDGWLLTGDIGRFTDDGFLQIIDRKKDILVTAGGKNVAPTNIEVRFNDDALISHVVVYGDGRRYLTAGVWLEPMALAAAVEQAGVAEPERDAFVQRLVQERIDRVNAQVASFESIKRFRVMSPALTIAGGLLTPTLKVKRRHVYEAFRDAFEGMYA